jgi:hypothetical protein
VFQRQIFLTDRCGQCSLFLIETALALGSGEVPGQPASSDGIQGFSTELSEVFPDWAPSARPQGESGAGSGLPFSHRERFWVGSGSGPEGGNSMTADALLSALNVHKASSGGTRVIG